MLQPAAAVVPSILPQLEANFMEVPRRASMRPQSRVTPSLEIDSPVAGFPLSPHPAAAAGHPRSGSPFPSGRSRRPSSPQPASSLPVVTAAGGYLGTPPPAYRMAQCRTIGRAAEARYAALSYVERAADVIAVASKWHFPALTARGACPAALGARRNRHRSSYRTGARLSLRPRAGTGSFLRS